MSLTEELSQALKTKYIRLSDSDTTKLIILARKGGEVGKEAITTLVLRNIRLIVKAANRYKFAASSTISPDDLVQHAMLAFLNAVRLYDPKAGVRFSTYATWAMRRACSRGLSNEGMGLRLPVHAQTRLRKIRAAIAAQPGQRKPTYAKLASATGYSQKQVERTLRMPVVVCSLDEPDSTGRQTVGDRVPALEHADSLEDKGRRELLEFLRSTLDPEYCRVLCWHHGLDPETPEGLTADEISRRAGHTRARVVHMIKQAESQLRAPIFVDQLKALAQR